MEGFLLNKNKLGMIIFASVILGASLNAALVYAKFAIQIPFILILAIMGTSMIILVTEIIRFIDLEETQKAN